MHWYILYRNGSREISNMVVAWLEESDAINEIDAYVEWDKKASGATTWELVQAPRSPRENYFKRKLPKKGSDPDGDITYTDQLEYHWVLEDYRAAEETILRKIPSVTNKAAD